ncbi:MAG TPA: hypothetical protein VG838_02620 [Opitutaceae bacterium]|nr:hypothetical protein [Opitutaceae bacterium]HWC58442.1 hypothetical protein [Verrucomicrobiae bacterium]
MSSYLRKIEAERAVLETVNRRYPQPSLHGLSAGAIASWAKKTRAPAPMLAALHDVGQLVGAMCERSGERNQTPERRRQTAARRAVLGFQSRFH